MRRMRACEWSGFVGGALAVVAVSVADGDAQWPQWGGPSRNFKVETSSLAEKWPEGGPRIVWRRPLGDGCSAIVVDDGLLYTAYREGKEFEYIVALDAETGQERWNFRHRAVMPDHVDGEGHGGGGPNATALIVGDSVVTVGTLAVVHAFHKKTGRVLWTHDLVDEFGAGLFKSTGYSSSPIAYGHLVILPAGRVPEPDADDRVRGRMTGQTLVAFDATTGELAWKSLSLQTAFSSPIVVSLGEADQLLLHTMEGLIAVNPRNGDPLWQSPSRGWIVTPVWDGRDALSVVSGFEPATCQLLRLARSGDQTLVREVWSRSGPFAGLSTPVLLDGLLIGATRQSLIGVDLESGKRLWAKRGFPLATFVHADGKLIILDEDGTLTLAVPTREGVSIRSQCKIAERHCFTVPSLVGPMLYVRDRKHVMALDLGTMGGGAHD